MRTWLLNPFTKVAGGRALAFGAAGLLLAALSAWLYQARFDGVLDMHFLDGTTLVQPLLDGVVNVLALTLVFYPLGLWLNRGRVRLLDVAGTMALARAPFALLPLLNAGGFLQSTSVALAQGLAQGAPGHLPAAQLTLLLALALVALGVLVWTIGLYYRAYTVSCNLRGARGVVSFVVGLIAAEALSKWLIYNFIPN